MNLKTYKAEWAAKNKEKMRDARAKWKRNNPEKHAKAQSDYASNNTEKIRVARANYRHKNKEKLAIAAKLYRENNIEKCRVREITYKESHRTEARYRSSMWAKKNPERTTFLARKHQAARLNAVPKWANEFFMDEAYRLSALRTKVTGIKWEVDHIVPLQSKLVCGLHCEQNIQVIPALLNKKKSNVHWPDMP